MSPSRKTKSPAKKSQSATRTVSAAKTIKKTSAKKKTAKKASVKKTAPKKKSAKKAPTKKTSALKAASKITRTILKKKSAKKRVPVPAKKNKRSEKRVEKETFLTPKQESFNKLYQMLWERRQIILQKLDIDLDPREEAADKGGDMADIAQETSEHELSFHLAEVESRELDKINAAINKLTKGTYGICESCGGQIAVARLKALPFANKCIHCQEQDEQQGKYAVAAAISYWE
ncbi:MAG: TraR/DksA family transcriptional regulator [Planctomycetaceae bacterium]|jgi:DnaK suppressor protein|nr:TraR/DksA family transcriptional regulator [Planctomycetaceae bacterium]